MPHPVVARSKELTGSQPLHAIVFGSQKKGSDLDVLLIHEKDGLQKTVIDGVYDLSNIAQAEFQQRLSLHDIEYTDPVLTGTFVHGDIPFLQELKRSLKHQRPGKASLDYLGKRSLESFLQTEHLYNEGILALYSQMGTVLALPQLKQTFLGKQECQVNAGRLHKTMTQLTYPLSYISARDRYAKGSTVVTFKQLVRERKADTEKLLAEVLTYGKRAAKEQSIDVKQVYAFVQQARVLLGRRL